MARAVETRKIEKPCHLTDELATRGRDNAFTKDFLDLKKNTFQYVFVYGTLRIGGHNFKRFLEDQIYLGEAGTVTGEYTMFDTKYGFPVVFNKGNDIGRGAHAYIYGDCFAVDPIMMLELDRLEGNGQMYTRQQRFIWLYDQKVTSNKTTHPSVKAWVYLANPEYWEHEKLTQAVIRQPKNSIKKYHDWNEPRGNTLFDDLDDGPEFGTQEYYERYYNWSNGRYAEGTH